MTENELKDEIFILKDSIEKIQFLSSCIMNDYFDLSVSSAEDRELILYSFSHSGKMFEILNDYICYLKKNIHTLSNVKILQ